ncbi:ABC transporter ATP-binding protein [Lacibacterium aquatile]|uniref:ABC transporter ATP-binding protein n=1 Tax=Lacibacterium aquatile TaxID=1168082 RepID=A0ABW5DRU6_9PROT
MSGSLVEIRKLTLGFAGVAVVRDIDIDLPAGKVTALIGESGSGKSLTALALAGLLPKEAEVSGDIRWPGRTEAPQAGRDIGLVFQDPMSSLHPILSIGEQVAEVLATHRPNGKRRWQDHREGARALLDRVGIDGATSLAAYPHQFSGGMRQRVAIAMALAGDPELLIADEPTTALDVRTQGRIVELLKTIGRERSLSLLLITHDLALAAQLADCIVVLYAGRVMEAGPLRRLLDNPRHPYTAGLIATSLDLGRPRTDLLPEIPGSLPQPGEQRDGCPFAPRCPKAGLPCREMMPVWRGTIGDGVACHNAEAAA